MMREERSRTSIVVSRFFKAQALQRLGTPLNRTGPDEAAEQPYGCHAANIAPVSFSRQDLALLPVAFASTKA
jgi:hypothetical protein